MPRAAYRFIDAAFTLETNSAAFVAGARAAKIG
jgi:hypothetical protein